MKNTKRVLAFVLATATALSVCACGKKNEETEGTPTLKWYMFGSPQKDQELVEAEINKILEKELGAKLTFNYIEAGVYTEKMQMAMASREEYDLCFTGYINQYIPAAQKGGLLEITDRIEKSKVLKEVIPQYALDAAKINGKIYGIPNLQVLANGSGLTIEKGLFEEWGQMKQEDIKTTEDIEPFMEWLVENHPEKYAAQAPLHSGWAEDFGYEMLMEVTKGVDIIERDGKIYADFAPKLEEKLYRAKKQREYFEKGFYRSDLAVVTDDSADSKANKYAISMGITKPGSDVESSVSKGIDVFQVNVETPVLRPGVGKTAMTGIGKNTKYPDKAFGLLELVNSNKDLFNIICFGIEGTHYNKVDEKHIKKIADTGYNPGGAWKFGSQFNSYLLEGQADDLWEKTIEYNNSAKVSPIIDFTFDNTPVRTEIAQIETIYSKYNAFKLGFLPMEDYYDEFISELEKAGVQKVIDEVNKQLEEYQKNK